MTRAVAVVGVGGLGCPAAWCLARAGVPLRLIDEDRVEVSNLHRQMLYRESDVGRLKVEAARDALHALNANVACEFRSEHVVPERALELLKDVALVVEGSDNYPTKFLVADACKALGIPVVHGACVGWIGTVLPVIYGESACYRCVFEDLPGRDAGDEPLTCATAGVYGPLTSAVGAMMAADALRLLRGDRSTAGVIARYDGWNQTFRATRFRRRRDCPLCAEGVGAVTLETARYVVDCG